MFRFFVLTILLTFVVLSNVEAHDTSCYYLHYNGRVSSTNPNGHRLLTGSALASQIRSDPDIPDNPTIINGIIQVDSDDADLGSYNDPGDDVEESDPYLHKHYYYIDKGGGEISRRSGSWTTRPEPPCDDASTYSADTPEEFLPGGSSNPFSGESSNPGTTGIDVDIDVKVDESNKEIEITITFNEAISDFDTEAITVRINGNTSSEQFSGSGRTYILTATYTGTSPTVYVQIDPDVTSEGNADRSTTSIITKAHVKI